MSNASREHSEPFPRAGGAAEKVFESLRSDIAARNLSSGDRLPNERDLATQFGVSQPTVREAIRALDAMGLVEVKHGSGVVVRGNTDYLVTSALQILMQIEDVKVLDALELRGLLGKLTVAQAAERASTTDIATLESCYRRLDNPTELDDVSAVVRSMIEFQEAVAFASCNPLVSTIESVLIRLLLHVQLDAFKGSDQTFWSRRASRFQADRAAIVDAIRQHDPDDAVTAMQRYLEHQSRQFRSDPALSGRTLAHPDAVRVALDLRYARRKSSPGP